MEKEKSYLRFVPGVIRKGPILQEDVWFLLYKNEVFMKLQEGGIMPPTTIEVENCGIKHGTPLYLGTMDGCHCYVAEVKEKDVVPSNWSFCELRSLFGQIEEETFSLIGRAIQILAWEQTHKYCGRCGTLTQTKESERAKICPNCGFLSYPRLSPAIIVAIIKDKQILLAHGVNFPPKRFSVLAGFVEPGETFEQCVKREVMEEVGIKIKEIKYFGSQPWPFPNSVMVGFTAEYDSGEIEVDGVEIEEANWFSVDNLPEIPSSISISRRLIDWFVETYKC